MINLLIHEQTNSQLKLITVVNKGRNRLTQTQLKKKKNFKKSLQLFIVNIVSSLEDSQTCVSILTNITALMLSVVKESSLPPQVS